MADTPMKCCSKGDNCVHPDGCWQPATTEHFRACKTVKSGLRSICRACDYSAGKKWSEKNKDKVRASQRKTYHKHRDRIRKSQKTYYENNKDKVAASNQRWRDKNPDKVKHINAEYYKNNKPEIIKRATEWNKAHPERRRIIMKRHYSKHRQKKAEYAQERRRKDAFRLNLNSKIWALNNPEKVRAKKLRYRARKKGLPNNYTSTDWQRALDYFAYHCAVCGNPLNGLFHTAAADHWIPLSDARPDNPGTVPWNIIPLCHGDRGCNNSKGSGDPLDWLTRTFGKRRAKKILARIEIYFKWVRTQS